MTAEERRLEEARERTEHWKRWGPYLSERAWGTVREDYSRDGAAWDYLPHDHARSRAYRWNEDGIAGICDRHQEICFAIALWNGRDSILKERLFGLSGPEGNHGEDVKEYYFYLDSTPTHSYMKYLYKYPQKEFPYGQLVEENRKRGKSAPEYELMDTGVFDEDRYFDIFVEYAKADAEEILCRVTVINRGPETAQLHLLPTIWFRNRWSWGYDNSRSSMRRKLVAAGLEVDASLIELEDERYGRRLLYCEGTPELLFTENETNSERLFGVANRSPYVKDGINNYIVHGAREAVNPAQTGTKASAHYLLNLGADESATVRLHFTDKEDSTSTVLIFGEVFDQIFSERQAEADEFYAQIIPQDLSPDAQNVMRQSFAGLLWSKQYYHYVVEEWLKGDPCCPPPPEERWHGRNHDWRHLYNSDVISMPDKWEYPWYAAWDLAFHCIPLSLVDSDFAKDQLILMLREWYMHPNGQIPAYEWSFDDVNPPVHAWSAWRVYRIEAVRRGTSDRNFLERIFHKLLLNFTWWVNRKDAEGNNIFEGGFLGLDNIGVFDRNTKLPGGSFIEQSDGTSWMAMYTLNLMAIAMELAREDRAYEDVASKFWEHFIFIAYAMNNIGRDNVDLWNEEDGFYYDVLHTPDGQHIPMRVHSIVGLIPLFAVETLEPEMLDRLPGFRKRMEWFIQNRPDLTGNVASMELPGKKERRLLSVVTPNRLRRVLKMMLDENEFLSPHGIRAISRYHLEHPFSIKLDGVEHRVDYEPAESTTGLFGGNSNWRGPLWFPINYLIIESLQKFHYYFGDDFQVEFPTGSGQMMNLWDVAAELSRRLSSLFLKDTNGRRPIYGGTEKFQSDQHWRDHLLFYEYFHGDNGAGLGASHQTGWTGLVAKLLQQSGEPPGKDEP
ncbi:MAG: glucosidase [Acidobacteria bacterium]|nr:MAG: glucosidase [Acidobacteriota bacterium]